MSVVRAWLRLPVCLYSIWSWCLILVTFDMIAFTSSMYISTENMAMFYVTIVSTLRWIMLKYHLGLSVYLSPPRMTCSRYNAASYALLLCLCVCFSVVMWVAHSYPFLKHPQSRLSVSDI